METIVALGSTHPHIAFMLSDPISRMALIYAVLLPSPDRNRLRKGDGVIRQFDKMGKAEKKQALLLAKHSVYQKNCRHSNQLLQWD